MMLDTGVDPVLLCSCGNVRFVEIPQHGGALDAATRTATLHAGPRVLECLTCHERWEQTPAWSWRSLSEPAVMPKKGA